ncbi:MAG: hypothetical protein J0H64_08760 [Actinobacteria bacterium]|nr:hypothetical protein [Actinomycetota bacterium]
MNREPMPHRLERLRAKLWIRRRLVAHGFTEAGLRGMVHRGELLRILQGRYVFATDWEALNGEDRHLLRALAVDAGAVGSPVFSHFTSALLHGLPLLRFDLTRVHISSSRAPDTPAQGQQKAPSPSDGSRARVIRHHRLADTNDLARTGGLVHTSLIRAVVEVTRTAPFAAGVVCADAALRRLVRMDDLATETARTRLLAHLDTLPGAPGTARARRVLRFASALAESPLESLSRLQLARLGFEILEQVAVPARRGRPYRLDFELIGRRCFVEADGKVKYTDEDMLNGRTANEKVFEEKRRGDWISGVTGKSVLHIGWPDAQAPRALGSTLRSFGVPSPSPDGLARPELY